MTCVALLSAGYCPQFDALLETMTSREILTMFARIKVSGLPTFFVPFAANSSGFTLFHSLSLFRAWLSRPCRGW